MNSPTEKDAEVSIIKMPESSCSDFLLAGADPRLKRLIMRLNDGLCIVIVTAVFYVAVYFHQWGIYNKLELPEEVISIGIDDLIAGGISILVMAVTIFAYLTTPQIIRQILGGV